MESFKNIQWLHVIYALALFLIGYLLSIRLSLIAERSLSKRFSRHQAMITRRLIFYILFAVFAFSALQELGFKLSILLGAAGIVTVALSFASQTAASNLISGIFLLIEHPFRVGDLIEVNTLSGNVESIDLLSTKIKTAENLLIRIPNETLIKSPITNFNYYKTRRVDIVIGVSYRSNIEEIKQLLLHIAAQQEKILKTPEPAVVIKTFAESCVELKLMVWSKATDFNALSNELKEIIKLTFDKENIEMPFPQMTVHQAPTS